MIWAALLVSGAGLLAVLLLAVLPERTRTNRRRRGRHQRDAAGWESGAGGAEAIATLASPLEYPPAPLRPSAVVVTALLLAAILAIVTRPWIGLVVGAAAAAGLLVSRTRRILTAGAVGLMVAAGMVVAVDQATHHVQAGGTWAPTFSTAALLAWGAVACLVADATVELLRQNAARAGRGPEAANDPPYDTPDGSGPPG